MRKIIIGLKDGSINVTSKIICRFLCDTYTVDFGGEGTEEFKPARNIIVYFSFAAITRLCFCILPKFSNAGFMLAS